MYSARKRLLTALPVALLALAGCGRSGSVGEVTMPDRSKETIEQKIKSLEASDLPPQMKEKAIQDLRAKQK